MFKLTALLCAAMFAVFLIAGEDRGQLRPGLANAARVAAEAPAPAVEPAPVVVAAAPVESAPAAPAAVADVAPVETPVTVDPVTTPETETAIEETVFSLANYGDDAPADQTATAASANVETVGYVDAEEVNVRQGPGTDNPVLTRLNRGEAVTIVATDAATGWARIRIEGDGIEGFMSMDYLSSTP
jgi:Bacterial SH3 domain